MLTASFVLIALGVAVVLGGALTAYLWLVRRERLEVTTGIQTLAAMRWREFSHFVIEALHAQGFEASRSEPQTESNRQSDLLLDRGEQTWLLSCKQGAKYRITASQVNGFAKSVREAHASGGILATLGRIETGARARHQNIELLDGATLWPLIEPLLPPSLHTDLAARARADTVRNTELAWLMSLLAGIALAMLLAPTTSETRQGAGISANAVADVAPIAPATPQPTVLPEPAPLMPAPVSEDELRDEEMRTVSTLPGIERALWSTRSTLVVYLQDPADDKEIAELCAALERYDALRASRLQLQPPTGSDAPVRFMQCRAF